VLNLRATLTGVAVAAMISPRRIERRRVAADRRA
jgi:hypothetical protein